MLLTIVIFIAILGVLVFVHELGHFLMARRVGIAVEEFGFGFPPRLIGWQRWWRPGKSSVKSSENIDFNLSDVQLADGTEIIKETITDEKKITIGQSTDSHWQTVKGSKAPKENNSFKKGTIYSFNWIPIGGFVKVKGEQDEKSTTEDSFLSKKIWQRALFISAGVTMNLVLAMVILSIAFMVGLPTDMDSQLPSAARIKNQYIQIAQIEKGSPAETAGLQAGDAVLNVDGQQILKINDFQNYTKTRIGEPLNLEIKRGNETIEVSLTPQDLSNKKIGQIGVWLVATGEVSYPWYYAIWMGIKTTLLLTWQIIVALFELLKNLIVSRQVSADVAGPVGIAVLTGQIVKLGFIYILQFAALLSINLAIINFIPFPALDGGRILFLIIEKIRGKPVNRRIENLIHNVGFFVLIGLVALVTFRDVTKLSDSLRGFLGNIF